MDRSINKTEPPSPAPNSSLASNFPCALIGRDRSGHWVVQDRQHRFGGLFVNRMQALKFALFENGDQPQAVIMVPGTLELETSGTSDPASDLPPLPPLRHVA